MIVAGREDAAVANLEFAYTELGRRCPESTLWNSGGMAGCYGPLAHALANFALARSVGPGQAQTLATMARRYPTLHVYLVTGPTSGTCEERLVRAGFAALYSLALLSAPPGEAPPPPSARAIRIERAAAAAERLRVSRFMLEQFASRQIRLIRDTLAGVTAEVPSVELYGAYRGPELVGGLLLVPTKGALGVYNLCVAAPHRGQGIGSGLVRWARSRIPDGALATLQCAERLVPWYEAQGFERVGEVKAFAINRFDASVTM